MTPDSVLDHIKKRGDNVSFVELTEIPGGEGNLDLLWASENGSNLVLWSGVSEALVEALGSLLRARRVHYFPTSPLTYLIDGAVPRLPVAKSIRHYKAEHWLPVVVKLGPPPMPKRARRRREPAKSAAE